MNNIKAEDLLEYLYKETSPDKSAQVKTALKTDFKLSEEHSEVLLVCKNLDKLTFTPSAQCITNILEYAEN